MTDDSTGDLFTEERIQKEKAAIQNDAEYAEKAVQNAESGEVLETLVHDFEIDIRHNGERGLGNVREAILRSDAAPKDLKKEVGTRSDVTTDYDCLVPDEVQKNALGALQAGKPVVLYGPTGTGKTTFAKQLALETSIGYSLHTASPSWTKQDIIGRIAPDHDTEGNSVSYRKELGCISEAVKRSRDFNEDYAVVLDEITRADISKIFGPLYTAIENPHQTIFRTPEQTIELDPSVNIICTMNMSDRTVNQLDNAITRRFAMIEVSEYTETARDDLFEKWSSEYLSEASVESSEVRSIFHWDYNHLNGIGEEDGIIEFGPMHYEDVAKFLAQTCGDGGVYENAPKEAVGQAFRTYIIPRLLNSATFPQIEELVDHYSELDEETKFNLEPAVQLVNRELQSEKQKMGGV